MWPEPPYWTVQVTPLHTGKKWMMKKNLCKKFKNPHKIYISYYICISLSITLSITEVPGLICKL